LTRVALSTIREDCRLEYDLPAFSSTGFVTTTNVTRLINLALKDYYALLLACYGDDYFDTETTLTTTSGVELSSLPTGFEKLRKVLWLRGTDDVVEIKPASSEDRALGGYDAKSWDAYGPRYRLQGGTIRWYPKPADAYSVQLVYAALPADLVADEETFEAVPSAESYIINEVCRRIAVRQDSERVGTFAYERDRAEQRIRIYASERDEAEPQTLRGIKSGVWESTQARRDRLTRL